MPSRYFIGVDGGTQSTKVAIYKQDGELVASAQQALQPIVQQADGIAYHPDDDLWTSLVAAMHLALSSFVGTLDEIAAIGLCSIRCCRAIVREDGTLVEPVISWMDTRLAKPHESTCNQDSLVTSTTGYLGLRLTGQRIDSAANYEGVWPVDKTTWDWSTDEAVFRACGVQRSQLSDLRKPGEAHGLLTGEAARELKLLPGIPVVCTANDKAVEALGSGLHQHDAALISLGTYVCGMQVADSFIEHAESYYSNLACLPEHYLLECDGVREGMRLMTWLKRFLSIDADQELDRMAASVPIGCDGLVTLPNWLPPASDRHRKGVTLGWQAQHTAAHFVRSVYEGLVLTLHKNLTAMWNELGTEPNNLLISGGGAQSSLLTQMIADVFNKPCGVALNPNTVSLGAAICAVAHVEETSVDSAARNLQPSLQWTTPGNKNASCYARIQQEFYSYLEDDTESSLRRLESLTRPSTST